MGWAAVVRLHMLSVCVCVREKREEILLLGNPLVVFAGNFFFNWNFFLTSGWPENLTRVWKFPPFICRIWPPSLNFYRNFFSLFSPFYMRVIWLLSFLFFSMSSIHVYSKVIQARSPCRLYCVCVCTTRLGHTFYISLFYYFSLTPFFSKGIKKSWLGLALWMVWKSYVLWIFMIFSRLTFCFALWFPFLSSFPSSPPFATCYFLLLSII